MELLNHTIGKVIEHTYIINHPNEYILVYKEWIDSETGECIDFVLKSKSGYEIDDAVLVVEVQEFINDLKN